MFWWDPMYFVFALPALILALYAQMKVQSAFNKYSAIPNQRRLSGFEAAQYLLRASGLSHVDVEGAQGVLADHYDPRRKVLRLSPQVATRPSIAALGVVAHEVGHALQDNQAYFPLRVRSGLVPLVNFGSWLGPILFLVGWLFLPTSNLAWIGVMLFALSAVFALVTLPVELDASRRALQLLTVNGLVVSQEEKRGVSQVL
ncbi:MAG: zinc metallopeptidase, partial [Chloroflexi bacterium]|nr:zinc metallopeptidase [Chloroflexota bacterium]